VQIKHIFNITTVKYKFTHTLVHSWPELRQEGGRGELVTNALYGLTIRHTYLTHSHDVILKRWRSPCMYTFKFFTNCITICDKRVRS